MATLKQERKAYLTEAFKGQADALESVLDGMAKANYDAYKFKLSQLGPVYKQRQTLVSKIPEFWFKSLSNCESIASLIDPKDRELLTALEDVWVNYGEEDVREIEFVFKFKDNKYLKNNTISKKLVPKFPAAYAKENELEQPSEYDLDAPLYSEGTTIEWKSDEVDLTKLAPRVDPTDLEEYDEFVGQGSFFHFFTQTGIDMDEVAESLAQWWETAIEYAANLQELIQGSDDEDDFDEDDDDDDEEDEEDDERVVDLEEERPKKKSKKN